MAPSFIFVLLQYVISNTPFAPLGREFPQGRIIIEILLQDLRKKIDLNVEDRIVLRYAAEDSVAEAVEEYRGYLGQEVLAVGIERVEEAPDGGHEVRVGEQSIVLEIEKRAAG